MRARSIQISLDPPLLAEVDRRPETKREGRSAIIRRALRLYLDVQQRRTVDAAYARAYGGTGADVLWDEMKDLVEAQGWPLE